LLPAAEQSGERGWQEARPGAQSTDSKP